MHQLFAHQRAKATKPDGEVDLDVLGKLVTAAYEQTERDHSRTERSIGLMVDELDQLNRTLEVQVASAPSLSATARNSCASRICASMARSTICRRRC